MPGIDFNIIPRVMSQTLDRYVGRGRKTPVVNETTERTVGLVAEFFRRLRRNQDSGLLIKEKLQFQRTTNVAQWVLAAQKTAAGDTKAPTWAEYPRRFARFHHYVDYAEIDTQKGEEEILNDLLAQAKEDVDLAVIQLLHDAFMARDGNYLHDGTSENLRMFGWRHFITPDGLHFAGQGSIGGINPTTQSLWRNQFINPATDSLGGRGISSITEMRRGFSRALQLLNFTGVNGFGKLASNVRGVPKGEEFFTQKDSPKDTLIAMTDPNSFIDLAEVLFDRQDDVGRDQVLMAPVFKGIPLMESSGLGIDATYGYGYDASGNTLYTGAPSGTFANTYAGLLKGYGELVIVNTKYMAFDVHSMHAPHVYDAYKPEGLSGVAFEGDIWPQLTVSSRRRVGCYVGPFAGLGAAA